MYLSKGFCFSLFFIKKTESLKEYCTPHPTFIRCKQDLPNYINGCGLRTGQRKKDGSSAFGLRGDYDFPGGGVTAHMQVDKSSRAVFGSRTGGW